MNTEEKQGRMTRTVYEGLVKSVLVPIKSQQKAWRHMSEPDQDVMLAQLDEMLRDAVRKVVDLVAIDERPAVKVTLKKIEFTQDAVKGAVTMSANDELRHYLADSAGRTVLLIPIDYEPYLQGEKPRAEPQQQDLALANAVETAFTEAEKAFTDAELKAQEEKAEAVNGCWIALVNVGVDWFTETDIAQWGIEQITEARAYAEACADVEGETPAPAMPDFLRQVE